MPQAFVALVALGAEKEVVTEVAVGIIDLYQLVVALFCVGLRLFDLQDFAWVFRTAFVFFLFPHASGWRLMG